MNSGACASPCRAELIEGARRPSRHILFNLALTLVLIAGLIYLRQVTEVIKRGPQVPQPLEFEVVAARFGDVRRHLTLEEIEAVLGPPTHRAGFVSALQGVEAETEHSNRHLMPPDRFWHRWADPNDDSRWIAILYAGRHPEYKAYAIRKNGF